MRLLIWFVFVAGAIASRYWFGTQGRIVYALVLLAAIVLFRPQLTILLTHVAAKFGLLKPTIERMPGSLSLVRASAIDEAARPFASELAAQGFVDAGAWNLPPMPKIRLALMVHPTENFLAAIETAAAIGAQVNVHTLYADDSVTTYSNSKLPTPKVRPQVTYVRVPGVSAATLVAQARSERRREGIANVSVAEAPRLYERLYAESIRFRKAQGA